MHNLDDAALAALGLDAFDYIELVSDALVAHFRHDIAVLPKRMQTAASGAYTMAAQGMWLSRDLALFHNLVGLDREVTPGQPSTYRSAQVLFRSSDAKPLLVTHGNMISSILPVTMGLLGARRFARPTSESLALIGAGLQGRLNLEVFAREFPLKRVRIFSRSEAKSMTLAARARELGLEAQICHVAEEAVRDTDIVVSSISESFGIKPFLDIGWLSAGAFVSTVDMLRPWYHGAGGVSPLMIADDVPQALDMIQTGRVPDILPVGPGLGEAIATGIAAPAGRPVILLQPGCCASILGMAATILAKIEPAL
jgi:ornithine cyclodeaminase/alanine dehydrogenase-like protein (mu-crystallin family)